MKLLTILGTRPEFIRLSLIIKKLNNILKNDHIIVNTGQNFDDNLSKVFLESMYNKQFKCNYNLFIHGSFAKQLSILFLKLRDIIQRERPDRFFVLGDTNSSMGGIIAKRMGLKVFHLEAGNRSFDEKTAEEVNRRIIDHCSDILMTYSQNSKRLLLNEGFKENQVFCVGNPIYEVIKNFENEINNSSIFRKLKLNHNANYHLCTLHRSENIDSYNRLLTFLHALEFISKKKKIILIVHPHLKRNLKNFKYKIEGNIQCIDPIGFFDFIQLEKNADILFTDSGTVQEEAQILNKKCIVLRDSTERWETVENGSCVIVGCDIDNILRGYEYLNQNIQNYEKIDEYSSLNVSDKVVKILLNNYLW